MSDPGPIAQQRPDYRGALFRVSAWAMVVVLLLLSPAFLAILGWFTEAYQDTTAASEVSHRLHEVTFGIFFTIALIGAITRVLRAETDLAGLIQLAFTVLTLSVIVTTTVAWQIGLLLYLVPLGGVLAFHPRITGARRGPSWGLGFLLLGTAIFAFLSEFEDQVARALTEAQNHTTHWSAMAAFVIVLFGLGIVVTLRLPGYRLTGFSLAGAAIGYGAVSIVFPFDASSHRLPYALGMVMWGVAWLVGLLYLDRPDRARRLPRLAVWAGAILVVPLVFILSAGWAEADDPPNVPHRPDPTRPSVMAADVDRATCLDCHATGDGGAPIPPHEFNRPCPADEPCWGGRSDCAGCHQIDPRLGGPEEQIVVFVRQPLAVGTPDTRRTSSLRPADLILLTRLTG